MFSSQISSRLNPDEFFYTSVLYLWEINLLLFLCAAAVDYLAKNVSLSTQRRMKLGEHSAVLGLLQVETGQAYWWIWTSIDFTSILPFSSVPTWGQFDRHRHDILCLREYKRRTLMCRICLYALFSLSFTTKRPFEGPLRTTPRERALTVFIQSLQT